MATESEPDAEITPRGSVDADGDRALGIRCPSCRKSAVIPMPTPEDFACQRCRCQLATLVHIRLDAAALIREARDALLHGGYARALSAASTAWDLRHTRAAAALAFISATLGGDALEGAAWLRASRLANLP